MVIKRIKKKGSTVYILCGLPGSGKSTLCKKYHPKLPIVSRGFEGLIKGKIKRPELNPAL